MTRPVNRSTVLSLSAFDIFQNPLGPSDSQAVEGITYLLWGLALVVAVPLLFLAVRRLMRYAADRRMKSFHEEMKTRALEKEKAGEFVSAGLIWEKLQDYERAAALHERGGDFLRAAEIYESLQDTRKVREMYEKAGELERAAEACMQSGEFIEAARLYTKKGDLKSSAHAFEMAGNAMAAVRAYREAKDYVKASKLLEGEGMYKEAADMFRIALTVDEEVNDENISRFYSYASLLEKAGDSEAAQSVYLRIVAFDPEYRDVKRKIEDAGAGQSVQPEEETGPEDEGPKAAPLKGMIQSGTLEPRYSLRLWVQILKALDARTRQGLPPPIITPESISIDAGNMIYFSESAAKDFAYLPPEAHAGTAADQTSAIYSMGVLLFAMLTGSLDAFGSKRPSEVNPLVPSWLDDLTLKCIERERDARFRSFADIFSALKSVRDKA